MADLEDQEDELGEYVELGDDPANDVDEDGDGNAYVVLDDQTEASEEPDFFANMVETLSPTYLTKMSMEIIELVDNDRRARQKRDEQYEEALRRSGLAEAPQGAEFEGASIVVHPMLLEAAIDFSSRIAKELIPADGIVKDKIIGKQTAQKVERAARKVRHMNWQLTEQIKEFRPEMEQGLTQVPTGGAFYMKVWQDPRLGRPACKAVYVDDVIIPYSASSFEAAQRRTHVLPMTDQEFEQAVESGMYVSVNKTGAGQEPEQTKTQKTTEKAEGKEPTGYNEDGLRLFYEVQIWLAVEEDQLRREDILHPYIVTIDLVDHNIVGWYRNWDPEVQDAVEEMACMQEFPFLPWRGSIPLSLYHLIGSLSVAATGALRAMLDAGMVNTLPTVLKLKGGLGEEGGQSKTLNATEVTEVEGGLTTDDVRKAVMPVPFNPPSTALFQLLGFLVDAGKGVIRTTMEDMADTNPNTPVGTTMMRYEQGMVVYSSIFGRLHWAMGGFLKILHRLNRIYMKESEVRDEAGEVLARRSDYEGPMDVVPVSDPRLYSETQRQMRIIAIMQRATGNPMYNAVEVEKMFLENMHLPEEEINRVLVDIPVPKMMNAVNENLTASLGRPISAYPEQDHLSHLVVHVSFLQTLGMFPNIAPTFMPIIIGHLREHIVFYYVTVYHDMLTKATGRDITELMDEDADVMKEFDGLLADASKAVMPAVLNGLKGMPEIVQKAVQIAQQYQQPGPMDPTAVAAEDVKRQREKDQQQAAKEQGDQQLKAQDQRAKSAKDGAIIQLQAAKDQRAAALEAEKLRQADEKAKRDAELAAAKQEQEATAALQKLADADLDRESEENMAAAEIMNRRAMNQEDNATALKIADMEIESADKVGVSTGTGINP